MRTIKKNCNWLSTFRHQFSPNSTFLFQSDPDLNCVISENGEPVRLSNKFYKGFTNTKKILRAPYD